jgi:ABC-type transporter Mla subunit MlaD
MAFSRTAFRVGFFVLAGVLALLAFIIFLSGDSLHPGLRYETYFEESVEGLDVGTAVKFRGVTIGKVTDVGLVSAEYPPDDVHADDMKVYHQVVVRFQVDPKKIGKHGDISDAIAHGLRIQIEPQGITGLAYLDLSFANPAQFPLQPVPWTPDSTVIPSMPSTLTQVQNAVQQLMASLGQVNFQKIINNTSSIIAVLNDELSSGDAHEALAKANLLLGTLNTTVQQANLPATTASVRTLADGPQTTQILAQLNATTAQLAKISAELPALVASSQATINQANETTADLQAQLGPILQDMKTTTANLRELTDELKRNPSQVLLGAAPPAGGGAK